MAVAQMAKVMIVSHRSQASELLEALQAEGICQILNAEEAMVSRDFPEFTTQNQRPKDIEDLLNQLTRSIAFLKSYTESSKGLAGILSPRTVIDQKDYKKAVSDQQILKIAEQAEQTEIAIEKLKTESENLHNVLEQLTPWESLETPVEQIGQLRQTTCLAGLIPAAHFEQITDQISELGAAIQQIGTADNKYACLIVCLTPQLSDVQKLLRSSEFEPATFESMTGTAAHLIKHHSKNLNQAEQKLQTQHENAKSLSKNLLKLQILHDHYTNLLNREKTRGTAPATDQTVILEGWVKQKNLPRLQQIVSEFDATSFTEVEPAEDEEIPVEIENKNYVRPFEVITRLYGMPQRIEVDPTVFLAPFFALFFALCLTDAGYGLVIIALMIFFIKKIQGDKKLVWMLAMCSAVTVVTGALTGGWFGDAVQQFVPALKPLRAKMMWFDPFEKPMMFFVLSLALGYFQIQIGLLIAFVHNLVRKDFIAAVCDQLSWLVMLNSIVIYAAAKVGIFLPEIGKFFGYLVFIPAGFILLFSHREGGWAGRIGMGAYNLFSAIFYIGDVLSYLRLMALGMVTAGIAMAVNVISKVSVDILASLGIPYAIGIVVMILILLVGHTFNLAISGLGAFVHTLRLQYVEFFPKFFVGGGRKFEPLAKQYKHVYIKRQST